MFISRDLIKCSCFVAGICMSIGILCFPAGWDNDHVRGICGASSDDYVLGDCGIRYC